jgi:hypothetical protein
MNKTNPVPYSNARREGRTSPGVYEMIPPTDPRYQAVPAWMRGFGKNRGKSSRWHRPGKPFRISAAARKLHREPWPPPPTVPVVPEVSPEMQALQARMVEHAMFNELEGVAA